MLSTHFSLHLVNIHIKGKGIDRFITGSKNDILLHLIEKNGIKIPNACEGNGACGTCMIYINKGQKLLNEPTDQELDVLDFAPSLKDTSRLSCRCQITSDDGEMELEIPTQSRNII